MIGRRAFVGQTLGLLGLGAATPSMAKSKPPSVLFICEFATAKSAIARELFRKRARERGIAVTAFSRGLKGVEDHVSPPLNQKLDAEGIDARRDGFAKLSPRDLRAANVIVTFVQIPESLHWRELLDWSAVPSVNDDWPSARADLDRRIDGLLDMIVANEKGRR